MFGSEYSYFSARGSLIRVVGILRIRTVKGVAVFEGSHVRCNRAILPLNKMVKRQCTGVGPIQVALLDGESGKKIVLCGTIWPIFNMFLVCFAKVWLYIHVFTVYNGWIVFHNGLCLDVFTTGRTIETLNHLDHHPIFKVYRYTSMFFLPFIQREITFVTSYLLPWMKLGLLLKETKNAPTGANSYFLEMPPIEKWGKMKTGQLLKLDTIQCISLKCLQVLFPFSNIS